MSVQMKERCHEKKKRKNRRKGSRLLTARVRLVLGVILREFECMPGDPMVLWEEMCSKGAHMQRIGGVVVEHCWMVWELHLPALTILSLLDD